MVDMEKALHIGIVKAVVLLHHMGGPVDRGSPLPLDHIL